MPFLEFLNACLETAHSDQYSAFLAEYRDHLAVIQKIWRANGIVGPPIPHGVLMEGSCPGEWRVYHAAVNPIAEPESSPSPYLDEFFLDVRVGPTNSQILGDRFDEWVFEANAAFNEVAEGRMDPGTAFASLTSSAIANHYRERTRTTLDLAGHRGFLLPDLSIVRKPRLNPFDKLLTHAVPDGVFHGGESGAAGAVFESKLSAPIMVRLSPKLALYSVFASSEYDRPFPISIILHASMEDGQLKVERFSNVGSGLGVVRANIQRLSKLVRDTHLHRRSNRPPSRSPQTWRQFLLPPGKLMHSDYGDGCRECPYTSRCWSSEGVPREQSAGV